MNAAEYDFRLRWKEELVARMPGGGFVIEAPMGILSVYFPSERTWERFAPTWAIGQWAKVKAELQKWCDKDNTPLYVEDDAYIQFT